VLAVSVTVSLRGDREIRKLLDSLSGRELNNRTRRATRAGASVMRADLRRRAASAEFPRSFRRTLTRNHRNPLGTSVGPGSPLINIFEGGAGGHTIAPSNSPLLAGPAGKRWRDAPFLASEPVSHPGMGARPLIGPVFEATKDEAARKAMDTMLEGIR
jgi:hypothetical protein